MTEDQLDQEAYLQALGFRASLGTALAKCALAPGGKLRIEVDEIEISHGPSEDLTDSERSSDVLAHVRKGY